MHLRAAEFHIKRSPFNIRWVRSVASRKTHERFSREFSASLPDENFYFDEVVKKIGLERVAVGREAKIGIDRIVLKEKRRVESHLTHFTRDQKAISGLVSNIDLVSVPTRNVYLLRDPFEALVCEIDEGKFVVIAQDENSTQKLMSQLLHELQRTSKLVKFTGYLLERFRTGRQLVESCLANRRDIISATSGRTRSPFESWVKNEVRVLTDSFVPNIVIRFKGPTEEEEYDCLVALAPEIFYDIEATDYSSVTADILRHNKSMPFIKETLKSTLLVRSQQKAKRIGAKALIVAKGFPGPAFNDLRRIGSEMGVGLVDENHFRDTLQNALITSTIEKTTARTPTRSLQDFSEALKRGRLQLPN
jgi:hypothetical protein